MKTVEFKNAHQKFTELPQRRLDSALPAVPIYRIFRILSKSITCTDDATEPGESTN